MKRFKVWSCVLMALLGGCSLTPEYRRMEVSAPKHWKNENSAGPSAPETVPADWWRQFGSAELDRLILEALNNNMDLTAARERIGQFRGLAKIAGAPLWPAGSAAGGFDYADSTRSGGGSSIWHGAWNMSYEVDLWGGIRAGRDAAMADVDTARYAYDALRLVVMGDVAQSYFAIVGLKERRRIAQENLENINEVLDIIIARFEAGGASALDVAQQRTERANAAAAVASFDQQIAQSENALAVLLGRTPQQFRINASDLWPIVIPNARSSEAISLLDRRPDIRGAESELIAAHADIGRARAAFYPRLQLNADNVFNTAAMSQPAGIAVALASSLTTPLFQGGRLEGELERTLARRTELVEIYRKTLLTAYREVEDALALGRQSSIRRDELLRSVDSAKKAYELARNRYLAGAIDYQTLLNAQRSWLNSQDSEVQAHVDVLSASVLLYKALGGGWSGR
ncbi:MAG: efflux transporter outer membrane subunit [Gammaproteobacteria bacterium]